MKRASPTASEIFGRGKNQCCVERQEKDGAAAGTADSMASPHDKLHALASAHGMKLLECSIGFGQTHLRVSAGPGREFAIDGRPGAYRTTTGSDVLVEGLFIENLEEIQTTAMSAEAMLKAAMEVCVCTAGTDDKPYEYEYDYSGGGAEDAADMKRASPEPPDAGGRGKARCPDEREEDGAAGTADSMASSSADLHELAAAHGLKLVECSTGLGQTHLRVRAGEGREFTIDGRPGAYRAATDSEFLLDGLFTENLEEVQTTAMSAAVMLKAAAEVYSCIAGGDDEDGAGGGNDKYEYDYECGDIDDEPAGKEPDGQEGGSIFEDSDISHLLKNKGGGGVGDTAVGGAAGSKNTRLMRDLSRLMRSDTESLGFRLELKNDDCLNIWSVDLFNFSECPLEQDMERLQKDKGLDHIRLQMNFKDDYPFSPPFVRVVYPRFKRSTGYILDGAFCMELLTNQGWTPTNDIESVVVQIRAQMVAGKARIDFDQHDVTQPYNEDRSRAAFRAAAKMHKWAISEDV